MTDGSTADDGFRLGGIGQIARHVSDIGRAVDFYGGALGLPHLYTYGDLAFFDCAGTRLFLSRTEPADLPAAQSIIYFRVPDIHAAHERLTGRGVPFEGAPHMIHRHPDGVEEWMAFFTDPDGGLLAIMAQTAAS
jgi:methylmalonyl-CoA/ethylmalonyl-CoA epimerase